MPVCPLCEHTQAAGAVCEMCGKQLSAQAVPALAVQAVEGLELTRMPAARATPGGEAVPGLEATRMERAPDAPVTPVPELEAFRRVEGQVAVEAVVDLDRGRNVDLEPRVGAPSGTATCRYCRNVQAAGLLCDKCGMRLPRFTAGRAAAAEETMRCQVCGSAGTRGSRCGECGASLASEG